MSARAAAISRRMRLVLPLRGAGSGWCLGRGSSPSAGMTRIRFVGLTPQRLSARKSGHPVEQSRAYTPLLRPGNRLHAAGQVPSTGLDADVMTTFTLLLGGDIL